MSKSNPKASNRFDLRKGAAQEGITVLYYRAEKKYEIYGSPDGKVSRAMLAKMLVGLLNVTIEEIAMLHTEFHFRPGTVRGEFGIDGQFLFVA